jgi:hypothetical protein
VETSSLTGSSILPSVWKKKNGQNGKVIGLVSIWPRLLGRSRFLSIPIDYHYKSHPLLTFAQNKESDTDIKLADFGFAKKVLSYNGCRTLCGTPGTSTLSINTDFSTL